MVRKGSNHLGITRACGLMFRGSDINGSTNRYQMPERTYMIFYLDFFMIFYLDFFNVIFCKKS